jgi:hypothetical protein
VASYGLLLPDDANHGTAPAKGTLQKRSFVRFDRYGLYRARRGREQAYAEPGLCPELDACLQYCPINQLSRAQRLALLNHPGMELRMKRVPRPASVDEWYRLLLRRPDWGSQMPARLRKPTRWHTAELERLLKDRPGLRREFDWKGTQGSAAWQAMCRWRPDLRRYDGSQPPKTKRKEAP